MGFETNHETELLLRTERRVLTVTDGTRVECRLPVVVWNAFDELVRPPIDLCRHELIGRSIRISRESGAPFVDCLQGVVGAFHTALAPPRSIRVVPRPRAHRS